jgi:hypothetical protein
MIILAGPCMGKTTVSKKYRDVVDVDPHTYQWLTPISSEIPENEKCPGEPHPDWPENYVEAGRQAHETGRLVLLASNPDVVRQFTSDSDAYLAYFDEKIGQVSVDRAIARGNSAEFVAFLTDLLSEDSSWINGIPPERHLICRDEDTYLEDLLLDAGLLTPDKLRQAK